MSNQFEFVGKLNIAKESEKFKPYEKKEFASSGWVSTSLKFNVIAGCNRHMLSISGGNFKDGHGDVYSYTKNGVDSKGNKVKGKPLTIPFKDRLTSPKLIEVAEFKKFVIDTEEPNRRYLLEKALEKVKEGTELTDAQLLEVGVELVGELQEAFDKSCKKRHEFISEVDFVDFIKKVIDSEKYKDRLFKVLGNVDVTLSKKNQKFYTNYIPSRIYLAKVDDTPSSTGSFTLYYNKEGLDDGSVAEKGKYYINGYTLEYDKDRKSNIPCPITVVLPSGTDEKSEKIAKIYVNQFTVSDDSWKEIGVKINILNGAQKAEITEDMLTDLEQELLMLGEITMDDIRKEMGKDVYGERVQENEITGLAKGYLKGCKPTVYIDEDFIVKPIESDIPDESSDAPNLFPDDEDEI